MMIWKYTLNVTDTQIISMPKGAKILSVAAQQGDVCMWAVVDPGSPLEPRGIAIVGTGQPWTSLFTDQEVTFLGTAVVDPFVWHVFEVK